MDASCPFLSCNQSNLSTMPFSSFPLNHVYPQFLLTDALFFSFPLPSSDCRIEKVHHHHTTKTWTDVPKHTWRDKSQQMPWAKPGVWPTSPVLRVEGRNFALPDKGACGQTRLLWVWDLEPYDTAWGMDWRVDILRWGIDMEWSPQRIDCAYLNWCLGWMDVWMCGLMDELMYEVRCDASEVWGEVYCGVWFEYDLSVIWVRYDSTCDGKNDSNVNWMSIEVWLEW